MSCRGLSDLGRPPFLTTARANIASVSSGSSLYSCGLITCASTRSRSEPKVRREAGLFTFIGLSHAEDMAFRATRRVANDHQATIQQAKADDSLLTVVLANVFDLNRHALEDCNCVIEVEPSLFQCLQAFGRIEGDSHSDIVYTLTEQSKPGTAATLATPNVGVKRQAPAGRHRARMK